MKDNQQQHACNVIILAEIATDKTLPVAVKFFAGWLRSFGKDIYMSNRAIITRYWDETGAFLSERQIQRYLWQLQVAGYIEINIRDNCKRAVSFCPPDKNVVPPDKNVVPPDKNVVPPDKNVVHSITNSLLQQVNTISSRYDVDVEKSILTDVEYLTTVLSEEDILYYLDRFYTHLTKHPDKKENACFRTFALFCKKDDKQGVTRQSTQQQIERHDYTEKQFNELFTPLTE